ncbi:DUF5336 domain-containing protein [Actinophytocola gossypii]|uniref:Uncharacterized protein n=1 Tax=Actinophytocola gossypii TaxID=2812003 RepID=A0ABT2J246_9PSEU|nr:DUF5336 domain-containing protein [Actinophytocola gossypii]MCT2581924.1 hypothetical protein [Actinophytocola gossypii]
MIQTKRTGAIALLAILPGTTKRPGPVVPALATGLMLESFFSLFVILDGVELAAGGILAIIFNVIMASLAITGYLLDVRAARGVPAPPVAHPAVYPATGTVPVAPAPPADGRT